MDLPALLAREPFAQLDEALRSYALEALGPECDAEEAAEVLGPYLLDAGLAADEEEVQRLIGCGPADGRHGDSQGPSRMAVPVSIGALAAGAVGAPPGEPPGEPEVAPAPAPAAAAGGARLSAARQAAQAAEAVKAALAPGARLALCAGEADGAEALAAAVARALRPELPEAGEGGQGADYLAASLVASAEERAPERLRDWGELLREVLEDAGLAFEGEELPEAAARLAERLARKGLLRAKARETVPGDLVLALLPEDEAWHEAVVETVAEDGRLHLVFVEYGRPLEAASADIRHLEDIVDDEEAGELAEGDCEMCGRTMPLTFHHLIPKDKHPTYMGKRLPKGIEGEPTRGFLNTYGLMICRQCHNTVHRIASNEILALEYNTLAKILEHPSIQRWVEYIKRQHTTRKTH